MVPVSPMLFSVVAYLIVVPLGGLLVRKPIITAVVLTVLLVSMSLVHARTFKGRTRDETLDSIPEMATFVGVYPDGDWTTIGKRLRAELDGSDVLIAMAGVGAVPYYSGLRTIDMWGLNDRVVAEHGNPAPASYLRPGHRRAAALQYLKDQKVNLIIAHLTLIPHGAIYRSDNLSTLGRWLGDAVLFNHDKIGVATVVAMPVNAKEDLLMWYLTPSPKVDQVISDHQWAKLTLFFWAEPWAENNTSGRGTVGLSPGP
jgi:hypothetical protein